VEGKGWGCWVEIRESGVAWEFSESRLRGIEKEMRRSKDTSETFYSFNTCLHKGRAFHVTQNGGRLVIVEVLLQQGGEEVHVDTGVDCKTQDSAFLGCCSLGEEILVMSGSGSEVFGALMSVGDGELRPGSVVVQPLSVGGLSEWPEWPYLCALSAREVILLFDCRDRIWRCEVSGGRATVWETGTVAPASFGFRCTPVRLSGGELVVAGDGRMSSTITRIGAGNPPGLNPLGAIPGVGRQCASIGVIEGRMLVGFGGTTGGGPDSLLDDLWVFDSRTGRASGVRHDGYWHPPDCRVAMLAEGERVYLIGGEVTRACCWITLEDIGRLIEDDGMRAEFQAFMVSRLKSRLEATVAEVRSLRAQIDRQRERADRAGQKATSLEVTMKGMRTAAEVQAANQRAEQLDLKLNTARDQITRLTREKTELEAQVAQNNVTIANLQKEKKRLERNLGSKEDQARQEKKKGGSTPTETKSGEGQKEAGEDGAESSKSEKNEGGEAEKKNDKDAKGSGQDKDGNKKRCGWCGKAWTGLKFVLWAVGAAIVWVLTHSSEAVKELNNILKDLAKALKDLEKTPDSAKDLLEAFERLKKLFLKKDKPAGDSGQNDGETQKGVEATSANASDGGQPRGAGSKKGDQSKREPASTVSELD